MQSTYPAHHIRLDSINVTIFGEEANYDARHTTLCTLLLRPTPPHPPPTSKYCAQHILALRHFAVWNRLVWYTAAAVPMKRLPPYSEKGRSTIDVADFSETPLAIYQVTQQHSTEDHAHRHENFVIFFINTRK